MKASSSDPDVSAEIQVKGNTEVEVTAVNEDEGWCDVKVDGAVVNLDGATLTGEVMFSDLSKVVHETDPPQSDTVHDYADRYSRTTGSPNTNPVAPWTEDTTVLVGRGGDHVQGSPILRETGLYEGRENIKDKWAPVTVMLPPKEETPDIGLSAVCLVHLHGGGVGNAKIPLNSSHFRKAVKWNLGKIVRRDEASATDTTYTVEIGVLGKITGIDNERKRIELTGTAGDSFILEMDEGILVTSQKPKIQSHKAQVAQEVCRGPLVFDDSQRKLMIPGVVDTPKFDNDEWRTLKSNSEKGQHLITMQQQKWQGFIKSIVLPPPRHSAGLPQWHVGGMVAITRLRLKPEGSDGVEELKWSGPFEPIPATIADMDPANQKLRLEVADKGNAWDQFARSVQGAGKVAGVGTLDLSFGHANQDLLVLDDPSTADVKKAILRDQRPWEPPERRMKAMAEHVCMMRQLQAEAEDQRSKADLQAELTMATNAGLRADDVNNREQITTLRQRLREAEESDARGRAALGSRLLVLINKTDEHKRRGLVLRTKLKECVAQTALLQLVGEKTIRLGRSCASSGMSKARWLSQASVQIPRIPNYWRNDLSANAMQMKTPCEAFRRWEGHNRKGTLSAISMEDIPTEPVWKFFTAIDLPRIDGLSVNRYRSSRALKMAVGRDVHARNHVKELFGVDWTQLIGEPCIYPGAEVNVRLDFTSNDQSHTLVTEGTTGKVIEVNGLGNAQVDFDHPAIVPAKQSKCWVNKENQVYLGALI